MRLTPLIAACALTWTAFTGPIVAAEPRLDLPVSDHPRGKGPEDLTWLEKKIVAFGRDPRYRARIAAFVNKDGGKWCRRLNAVKLKRDWKKTNLPNLDRVSDDLWRGGQPNEKGFRELQAKGVKTIINLRYCDDSERGIAMLLGLRYVYVPMPDTCPPTPEQVKQYRAALADPARGLTYVHCAAGSFRTSTMVGIYRLDHGMAFDAMLAEAKAHGFDPEMMNAPLQLEFLKEYAASLDHP